MRKSLLSLMIIMVLSMACTKEEIRVTKVEYTPEDPTLTEAQLIHYVNRIYISLTGRKPDSTELNGALQNLLVDPYNEIVRRSIISAVMQADDHSFYLWTQARNAYLDGVDTAAINDRYRYYRNLAQNAPPGPSQEQYEYQAKRLKRVTHVPDGLLNDSIDIIEAHRRIIDNEIYDQINMGTENFVVSAFQNFLFRYPTATELQQGKKMVDGGQAVLFLRSGMGKPGFIDIFFDSNEYFEGQIRTLFKDYLYREPTTPELDDWASRYQMNKDYSAIQTDILASDEYLRQ
ncbi:MAG: hypothetical protein LPK80_04980 [Bacteroidota bacterium]|nr:hypothetical protein [Bacteroidota bacterium]